MNRNRLVVSVLLFLTSFSHVWGRLSPRRGCLLILILYIYDFFMSITHHRSTRWRRVSLPAYEGLLPVERIERVGRELSLIAAEIEEQYINRVSGGKVLLF